MNKKILISISLALILLLSTAMFVSKREETRNKLAKKYYEEVSFEKFVTNEINARQVLTSAKRELRDIESGVMPAASVSIANARLQSKVQSAANSSGLSVISIKHLDSWDEGFYRLLALEIECSGSLRNIERFLNKTIKIKPYIGIDSINIKSGRNGLLRLKLKLKGVMQS